MSEIPADWLSLCVLVFLLGIKHGFDADHLATIDGLTRLNHRAGKRFARYCGSLFSLGHGAVVMLIAAAVGLLSTKWQTPAWLDMVGLSISIAFLFALGIANLRAVLAAEPGHVVAPVGVKARFLGSLLRANHPAAVAGVGALFALSFDTVSQSALFALTAARFGGIEHALVLGMLFLLGMLLTDGVNGLWLSRLIARADAAAALASRVMGLAVAAVSLLVGALSLAQVMSPLVAQWARGKEVVFGALVVATMAGAYGVALLMARRMRAALAAAEASRECLRGRR